MTALLAAIRKECLILLRDWHALVLLFAMPLAFIVIMSLALEGRFATEAGPQLPGQLQLDVQTDQSKALLAELRAAGELTLTRAAADTPLANTDALYRIHFTPDFTDALGGVTDKPGIILSFDARLAQRDRLLVSAAVHRAFARYNTTKIARALGYDRDYAERELLQEGFILSAISDSVARPNAVQQSVPAWLIFAMFFIAIPVSTTAIAERDQRTLARLQTMGVNRGLWFGAKLAPYALVNILQLTLMLAAGAWLLPALGGQSLSLAVDLPALALMGAATSAAALGYASLIASFSRTIEQATVASGAGNILLAAVGGVMIPSFVMSDTMQTLAGLSPMNWALEGFLTVLVRGGASADVAASAARLILFAIAGWLVATAVFNRDRDHA